MLTVLAWLWAQPGGRAAYTARHVNIWAAMVRRNLRMPHRIACVTDMPEGIDPSVEIIEPPRQFENWRIPSWPEHRPQCLRRLTMFAPDAASIFGERFVCMDLDCVIADSLDPLFDVPDDFRIFRGTARSRPYNGSMMLIRAGARPQVFNDLTIEGATEAGHRFVGSDQAWISRVLGPAEATWGHEHGVVAHLWTARAHFQTFRVMFFPGRVKPWGLRPSVLNRRIAAHYYDEAA